MLKKWVLIIAAIMIPLAVVGCGNNSKDNKSVNVSKETERENVITITCAGDCTLGTDAAFGGATFTDEVNNQNKEYTYFLKNVKKYFEEDDLTIVNLEGTLTERGVRQDKTFAFRGEPEYTKILTEGSVEAVTLANNHSKDYGEVSFEDTKKYLDEAQILWFENRNTRVVDVKGVKVGLIGLYDLDGSAENVLSEAIRKVKEEGAEIVIVQIHWGVEGDNYPGDKQISLAHKIIDGGADLIIGHHPHVLQGIESYKGKMIVYSMGNFCFGGNQNPRDKDTMIYKQTFSVKNGEVRDYTNYAVIPCSVSSSASRNNYQPTPAEGSEKIRIAEKIQKFSDKLGDINIKFEDLELIDDKTEQDKKEDISEDTNETELSIIL